MTLAPAVPGAAFKLPLERQVGARQAAHARADRHPGDFRRFLVAEALNGHEHQHRPLLRRKIVNRAADFGESQARFDAADRRIRPQPLVFDIAALLADVTGAELVDPDRLHDAQHPAVEPGALLELMLARERTLARGLDKIISVARRTGEAAGETPQSRQNRDQLIAEPRAYRIVAFSRSDRRFCLLPTERQRAS